MSLKPRFNDLLGEYRTRHQAFWDGLALLEAEEWERIPLAGAGSARQLLAELLHADQELAAAVEAAAVGLRESVGTPATPGTATSPGALLEASIAVAGAVDAQLSSFDNQPWQRKLRRGRGNVTLAGLVSDLNDVYHRAQMGLDVYLGSYERLGTSGLLRWLRRVYDMLMDSVAGMMESEIMGPAWCGTWNTYDVLVHAWAWNDVTLRAAERWQEREHHFAYEFYPSMDAYNEHLQGEYGGGDMVALADGVVTTYRKTAALVERAQPALMRARNPYPWPAQGTLCAMLFEAHRHAWEHALAIRAQRASGADE